MIDPQKMRVMIVDDMENMGKSIRGMMKVLGYGSKFRFGSNGREGWKILQEAPIDLAIIDWNMPIMTGIELLELIREDSNLRDMPVIMITAEANKAVVAEAAESDIDAYILKPLTVKSLGDKIENVIDKVNNPTPMLYHLKKSRDLEESGNIDEAIEEAKKALKSDSSSSRPIRTIGYLFFKKNDLVNAEKCFIKAIKMNNIDVFALHYLGEIYLKRGNIDKAAKFFEKAMSISPRHISRGIYLGKILIQKNNIQKAIEIFNKTIAHSDDSLSIREEILNICIQNQIHDYAIKLIDFIIKHFPERYDLILQLGIIYEKLGDTNKALNYYTQLEKHDKNDIDVKMRIARILFSTKQVFRADDKLKEIIKLDPENEEAKTLLRKNF